jgi:hypothetical protein
VPAGDYNIRIDTSAVLAQGQDPNIANYTPVQASYPTTSHQQWSPAVPRRTSEGTPSLQQWAQVPRRSSEGSVASSIDSSYMLPEYATPDHGPFAFGPYPGYPHGQHISPTGHVSPAGSTEMLLSPGGYNSGSQHVSPHTTPPHLTPPTTPGGSQGFTASPSPDLQSPLLPFAQQPRVSHLIDLNSHVEADPELLRRRNARNLYTRTETSSNFSRMPCPSLLPASPVLSCRS